MDAESFFLKYAFPCSFIIRERGEISQEEFSSLEKAAVQGKQLPREFLEKVYFRAFQKIEPLAREMGKDKWDLEVLREYFRVKHNRIIDQGMYSYRDAPPVLKELCKVQVGIVARVEEYAAVVELSSGRRPVTTSLVPEVKEGDRVTVHYGCAVEILEDK